MNPSSTYHAKRAWRFIGWAIAWLHGFIASAGFTVSAWIDEDGQLFALLPGGVSVAFLIAFICCAKEAARCSTIHFTRFHLP